MKECECGNGKIIEKKRYCACEDTKYTHVKAMPLIDPVAVVKKSPRPSKRG